jgi:hypothetical protein
VRSNDIISFLMVEGLRYNAVITCLMEDQNTNEPVVMWYPSTIHVRGGQTRNPVVECLWIGIPIPLIKDGFFA